MTTPLLGEAPLPTRYEARTLGELRDVALSLVGRFGPDAPIDIEQANGLMLVLGANEDSTPPRWVKKEPSPYDDEYGSYCTDVNYESMVRSWGYEVLSFVTCGSYQGDHVVLLRDGERYGYLVIGYGSCTGCDALQAVAPSRFEDDWSGVRALEDSLRGSIHWEPSPRALAAWLSDRKSENAPDWYWSDSEVREQVQRLIDRLRGGEMEMDA